MDEEFDKGAKKVAGSKAPVGSGGKAGLDDFDKGSKKMVMGMGGKAPIMAEERHHDKLGKDKDKDKTDKGKDKDKDKGKDKLKKGKKNMMVGKGTLSRSARAGVQFPVGR